MGLLRSVSCLAFSTLALAACSKGGSAPGAAAGPAGGPASASSASSAAAQADDAGTAVAAADLPHVKGGYWRLTGTLMGGVKADDKVCYSGKTPVLPATGSCQMTVRKTLLGKYIIDATCASPKVPDMKVVSRTTLSGDMQTHFVAEGIVKVTRDGKETTEVTRKEGTYIGPCPAGEDTID